MTDQSSDTKAKIIQTARILFADYGFEGTSIREIAKAAEVNIASVNYHFSSKEKLFLEILRTAYLECSEEMRSLYEKNQGNLEEMLVNFLRFFLSRSHDLVSQFKMMMSTQHSHHTLSHGTGDEVYGPPGGKVLAEALKREVPGISEENLHWALKTLFSHVTHTALIHSCCLKNEHSIPFSTIIDQENGIRRLTRVVLNELKSVTRN